MALPNPGMTFTPFDPLPASDLNDMVENIDYLGGLIGSTAGALTTLDNIRTQSDTTNATTDNVLIQTGWGFIQGSGSQQLSEAVTFPTAFDAIPIAVIMSYAGSTGSLPNSLDDFSSTTSLASLISSQSLSISASGFNAMISRSDNVTMTNTSWYGYSWIAIGIKT